ncbi:activating signal cointegrator 1 isoform X3 [Rhinatrema bivittatum]|uniref:activating signal cointegrator 1 isoform X3 n=1 Tax=Rhinatrema bivittatum TaxID=194408 RepID=UPI0011282A15|nr:activating signal cointegrator 1 isoform X3 [Rhinatrema bivittatum]
MGEAVVAWCRSELQSIFGLDVSEDIVQYILSIESEEEVEEYINDLVQGSESKKHHFIEELKARWQKCNQPSVSDPVQLYRRKDESSEVQKLGLGDQPRKGRRKGRNKQEAVLFVEAESAVEEVKTPLDLAKVQESSSNCQSKKKTKFVNLYTTEGQDRLAVLIPGRYRCECLAQKHKLINNCLTCGRIVCEQEGSGPCLFCGTLVCTKEEQDILQRDSNKSQKLLKKLMSGGETPGKMEVSYKDLLPHQESRFRTGLEKALQHKDKLIEFDKTSVRRTQVIDDESDYFATDSNQWLSRPEREALRKRERELLDLRHASRLSRKITIDFAGRQILEQQDSLSEYHSRLDETVQDIKSGTMGNMSRDAKLIAEKQLRDLVNPNLLLPAPVVDVIGAVLSSLICIGLHMCAVPYVTSTSRSEHISPILRNLHWLPVNFRILYKSITVIHKTIHHHLQLDLEIPFKLHSSNRPTRDNLKGTLKFPPTKASRLSTTKDRAFSIAGPSIWNNIPSSLRLEPCLLTFRKRLKTWLFHQAFTDPPDNH